MKLFNKKLGVLVLTAVTAVSLTVGCGGTEEKTEIKSEIKTEETVGISAVSSDAEEADETVETEITEDITEDIKENTEEAVIPNEPVCEIEGLSYIGKTPLKYASCFTIDNYEDGYALIDIPESGRYLVVPKDGEIPEGLDAGITILQQPLDRIYLAATSAMALFDAVDSIGNIKMSGTDASGWFVDNAVKAMENGDIIYAGKYSEPDYETLIDQDCDLAIESTMIYHTPKVKEMIEDLEIPVLVDRSSYEEHPLGRTEWIKLYGTLTGKTKEAESFFNEQAKVIEELEGFENTGKKIAFFFINTDGSIVVRASQDYIPKMIRIAGAEYIFDDIKGYSTSISITMEEFFAAAVDADYLIYNGSIDGTVSSMDDLIAKNELFKEFKAVKEGNVWNTGKAFYQATDIVGQMIRDINLVITDGDPKEMTFLKKI